MKLYYSSFSRQNFKKIVLGCACSPNVEMVEKIVNGHLSNLITSTSSNEVNGWTINCAGGVWNADEHTYDDVCYNWYGYISGMMGHSKPSKRSILSKFRQEKCQSMYFV